MNSKTFTETARVSGGKTGTICTKTGSYRCSSSKIQFIVFFKKGDIFQGFPSDGSATTWYAIKDTSTTSSSTFDAVL